MLQCCQCRGRPSSQAFADHRSWRLIGWLQRAQILLRTWRNHEGRSLRHAPRTRWIRLWRFIQRSRRPTTETSPAKGRLLR
jgi:hypothetical protein